MRIIEANDDAALAQASILLRLVGFASAADDLDAGTTTYELVLIAHDEVQTPVGMVWGRRPEDVVDDDGSEHRSALLYYVAVDPAREGHGIGSELVTAFCKRSQDAGADLVILHLGNASVERAAKLGRFYALNGFVADDHGFRREVRPDGTERPSLTAD